MIGAGLHRPAAAVKLRGRTTADFVVIIKRSAGVSGTRRDTPIPVELARDQA